jgi:hypothetical protein
MGALLTLIRGTLLSVPNRRVGSFSKSKRRAANKRARVARRITRQSGRVTAGQAFCLAFLAMVMLAWLIGCASFAETTKRHPYVTGFVVTSLAISGAQALKHHDERAPAALVIPTPNVSCATNPEACR